ncbi:GDSL-type esterase/lipase family protein [Romboutsia sedimentorum]|uniref:GDSL-type esterase/lipase family protein n=1 Tax=Romboutsia sedimentorum TaxID=1368474 RepID=UPI0024DE0048|nr:GDSL-type esterase/lipase family protein [Romboutsia sedimentorum]MDK2585312.1 GDSL-type esterase/lipase family protein [Romboutsia sedimentorum]
MKKKSNNFVLLILMMCLIFVPAIATYSLTSNSTKRNITKKENEEITNNISIISNLDKNNLDKIQKEINKVQSSYYGLDKNSRKIDYKDIFKNCVVMGDSQAEGLITYNMLSSTSVICSRGSNLKNAKSNMNNLSNLNPSNVFTLYGMNDLLIYQEDIPSFIKDYTSLINSIKKALPKSKIFVNSVLPIKESNKKSVYNNVDKYNKSLKVMCKDLNITFIDTTNLLKDNESLYANDGMHLKPIFYPAWLNSLKQSANL